jgi:hypothetical protein
MAGKVDRRSRANRAENFLNPLDRLYADDDRGILDHGSLANIAYDQWKGEEPDEHSTRD